MGNVSGAFSFSRHLSQLSLSPSLIWENSTFWKISTHKKYHLARVIHSSLKIRKTVPASIPAQVKFSLSFFFQTKTDGQSLSYSIMAEPGSNTGFTRAEVWI
jgi:hypothetical protein